MIDGGQERIRRLSNALKLDHWVGQSPDTAARMKLNRAVPLTRDGQDRPPADCFRQVPLHGQAVDSEQIGPRAQRPPYLPKMARRQRRACMRSIVANPSPSELKRTVVAPAAGLTIAGVPVGQLAHVGGLVFIETVDGTADDKIPAALSKRRARRILVADSRSVSRRDQQLARVCSKRAGAGGLSYRVTRATRRVPDPARTCEISIPARPSDPSFVESRDPRPWNVTGRSSVLETGP
jgi:hypothetical protein